MMYRASFAAIAIASMSGHALAAETITYQYDAKGRLVRVLKSGGPSSGTTTTYDHDKANNRTKVKTTGAPR